MKWFAAALISLVLFTGCGVGVDIHLGVPEEGGPQVTKTEYPTVNLPMSLRQKNWTGSRGQGSCAHASFVDLLYWQNRPYTADAWRRTHGNGELPETMARKMDDGGIRYAQVVNGDPRFLDWACQTRRGCGVTVMGGKHMVTLVHFDEKWAGILDSNDVSKVTWVPRETFVTEWQNSNGWAITPVYSPAPPLPY